MRQLSYPILHPPIIIFVRAYRAAAPWGVRYAEAGLVVRRGISWLILARICLRLGDKGEWGVCTPQDLSLTSNDRIFAYVNTIGL